MPLNDTQLSADAQNQAKERMFNLYQKKRIDDVLDKLSCYKTEEEREVLMIMLEHLQHQKYYSQQ